MATHTETPGVTSGRFRRALRRLSAPDAQLEAEDLQTQASSVGATPVEACPLRSAVCVAGTIRAVRIETQASAPVLAADVYDGSGTITAIFLGRRRIGGIEPGRRIVLRGRIAADEGRRVIFNPRYELLPPDYRCVS